MSKNVKVSGVGFQQTEGTVRQSVTKKHTLKDEGRTFKDNFGRSYIYTTKGLIY